MAHVVLQVVELGDGHEGLEAAGAEGEVGGVVWGGGVARNVDVLGRVDHFHRGGVVGDLRPCLNVPVGGEVVRGEVVAGDSFEALVFGLRDQWWWLGVVVGGG